MDVLYVMIPATFLLTAGFVAAFILSARGGQFDDLDSPAVRILFDEEEDSIEKQKG